MTDCLCTKTQDQYADGSYARSYTLDVDASCPNHGYLLAPLHAESVNEDAS